MFNYNFKISSSWHKKQTINWQKSNVQYYKLMTTTEHKQQKISLVFLKTYEILSKVIWKINYIIFKCCWQINWTTTKEKKTCILIDTLKKYKIYRQEDQEMKKSIVNGKGKQIQDEEVFIYKLYDVSPFRLKTLELIFIQDEIDNLEKYMKYM